MWRENTIKRENIQSKSIKRIHSNLPLTTYTMHSFLVILFPAQSHINPSFQLAKRLVALGAHVTVCTTLHMHRRISDKPSHPLLSFLPFSDGFDDGITITDFSLYAAEFKRRGSEFITNLISSSSEEGRPFTCLIHTLLLTWAAEVARQFHLPKVMFWVQPATVLHILYYYTNTKIEDIGGSSFKLPGLPFLLTSRDIPSFLLPSCPPMFSKVAAMFEDQFRDLELETNPTILVNTFEALEPEPLRAIDKFNLIPIGPLIPSAFLDGKDPTDTSFGGDIFTGSNGYIEWLDSKPEESVVYISFGSFCVLSKIQMEEIARGLLDSGFPFLWVIRENQEKEMLSCKEELENKGKIVKWCSQVEVLSHRSLACFVSHCGWNSTLESLASGVPMVAFPQWTDQMTNAKLIEDVWKIGVRLDHKVNEDGIVKGEEIKRCLEVVMESGEEFRTNAKKWKCLAREAVKEGGSSEKNLTTFLDHVLDQHMANE